MKLLDLRQAPGEERSREIKLALEEGPKVIKAALARDLIHADVASKIQGMRHAGNLEIYAETIADLKAQMADTSFSRKQRELVTT